MATERAVIFIGTMGNGGAQRVISLIAPKLIDKGLSVTLLTYYHHTSFYEIDSRVEVESVIGSTKSSSVLHNIWFIRRYMKKKADVVLTFLAPFNMIALFALLGLKIPVIAADRNDPTKVPGRKILRKLRNRLYNHSTVIVAQTEANAEYFRRYCRKPVSVIYNPVNERPEFGQGPDTPKENVIVTAGRLTKQKNHEMLIRAFQSFHAEHPEYHLVIYGEGDRRTALESMVKELSLADCVSMPGSKTNVLELMMDAKLFVLTSYYEGMPNALIEAMCIGLPVVSTKVSGATDLIKDGKNGYLIEVNDIDALYRHFCAVANDYGVYEQLGIDAEKICEQLNIDTIVNQWYHLVEKAAGKGAQPCF